MNDYAQPQEALDFDLSDQNQTGFKPEEEVAVLEPLDHGTLRDHVDRALANYFAHIDGHPVNKVYDLVLSEVEPPLLERVLKYTNRNQTRAAAILGLNRGTLRKKLKMYGLLT